MCVRQISWIDKLLWLDALGGGNVGDGAVFIPLPDWVLEAGEQLQDEVSLCTHLSLSCLLTSGPIVEQHVKR